MPYFNIARLHVALAKGGVVSSSDLPYGNIDGNEIPSRWPVVYCHIT
jgi:hypothetical protein